MGNDSLAKKGAQILLIIFLFKIFVAQIIKVIYSFMGADLPPQTIFIIGTQIFAILFPALIVAGLLRLNMDLQIKDILKFKKINGKKILLCAIIGCAVQAVTIAVNAPIPLLLNRIFGGLPPQLVQPPQSIQLFLLGIIVIAILPAICEELLFRGIILTTQRAAGGYGAIMVSAIYFAIMHNDISTFLGVFILGIVLGTVTLSTGSIFAAMIVHFFNNLFGFILQYMDSNHLLFWSGDKFYYSMAMIGLPILIISLRCFSIEDLGKGSIKQAFLNIPFIFILLSYLVMQYLSFSAIIK